MQKGLLCSKEKDDYICKHPSKCFWAQNLIKLMIRKKRCTEFIDVIRKMPCHQYVFNTIEQARELGRDPRPEHQHTNCNLEKYTKYLLLH